jgi:Protein of unknown function (DUF1616)
VVLVALVCAVASLVLPFEVVQVLFALPLTLFLPGYAIAAASFARRPLPWPMLLLLSLALSLSVLALGALLLNYVPGGIRETSWVLLLLLVILNGCRVAALRRPPAPEGAITWPRPRPSRPQALLLGGGGLAALAALILAMTPLPADNALGYTELWISTRDNGTAGTVARIGVRNQEQREVSYFLRVTFGGGKPTVRLFDLSPGESDIAFVQGPPRDEALPVIATLFRQERPATIYRRVVAVGPGERVASSDGQVGQ